MFCPAPPMMMYLLGASGDGVACPNRRQKIFFVNNKNLVKNPSKLLFFYRFDNNKIPVAIAGIKGGLKASISETTTNVLFESLTSLPQTLVNE